MSDLQVYLPLANVFINNLGKQATGKPTIRKKKKNKTHPRVFSSLFKRERAEAKPVESMT